MSPSTPFDLFVALFVGAMVLLGAWCVVVEHRAEVRRRRESRRIEQLRRQQRHFRILGPDDRPAA